MAHVIPNAFRAGGRAIGGDAMPLLGMEATVFAEQGRRHLKLLITDLRKNDQSPSPATDWFDQLARELEAMAASSSDADQQIQPSDIEPGSTVLVALKDVLPKAVLAILRFNGPVHSAVRRRAEFVLTAALRAFLRTFLLDLAEALNAVCVLLCLESTAFYVARPCVPLLEQMATDVLAQHRAIMSRLTTRPPPVPLAVFQGLVVVATRAALLRHHFAADQEFVTQLLFEAEERTRVLQSADVRECAVDNMLLLLRSFAQACSNPHMLARVERLHLHVAQQLFFSPLFDKRLAGLLAIQATAVSLQGALHSALPALDETSQCANFLSWLQTHHVVEALFGPQMHEELIARATDLIQFVCVCQQLTEDRIALVWRACAERHESIRSVIYTLFVQLAPSLSVAATRTMLLEAHSLPLTATTPQFCVFLAVVAKSSLQQSCQCAHSSSDGLAWSRLALSAIQLLWKISCDDSRTAAAIVTAARTALCGVLGDTVTAPVRDLFIVDVLRQVTDGLSQFALENALMCLHVVYNAWRLAVGSQLVLGSQHNFGPVITAVLVALPATQDCAQILALGLNLLLVAFPSDTGRLQTTSFSLETLELLFRRFATVTQFKSESTCFWEWLWSVAAFPLVQNGSSLARLSASYTTVDSPSPPPLPLPFGDGYIENDVPEFTGLELTVLAESILDCWLASANFALLPLRAVDLLENLLQYVSSTAELYHARFCLLWSIVRNASDVAVGARARTLMVTAFATAPHLDAFIEFCVQQLCNIEHPVSQRSQALTLLDTLVATTPSVARGCSHGSWVFSSSMQLCLAVPHLSVVGVVLNVPVLARLSHLLSVVTNALPLPSASKPALTFSCSLFIDGKDILLCPVTDLLIHVGIRDGHTLVFTLRSPLPNQVSIQAQWPVSQISAHNNPAPVITDMENDDDSCITVRSNSIHVAVNPATRLVQSVFFTRVFSLLSNDADPDLAFRACELLFQLPSSVDLAAQVAGALLNTPLINWAQLLPGGAAVFHCVYVLQLLIRVCIEPGGCGVPALVTAGVAQYLVDNLVTAYFDSALTAAQAFQSKGPLLVCLLQLELLSLIFQDHAVQFLNDERLFLFLHILQRSASIVTASSFMQQTMTILAIRAATSLGALMAASFAQTGFCNAMVVDTVVVLLLNSSSLLRVGAARIIEAVAENQQGGAAYWLGRLGSMLATFEQSTALSYDATDFFGLFKLLLASCLKSAENSGFDFVALFECLCQQLRARPVLETNQFSAPDSWLLGCLSLLALMLERHPSLAAALGSKPDSVLAKLADFIFEECIFGTKRLVLHRSDLSRPLCKTGVSINSAMTLLLCLCHRVEEICHHTLLCLAPLVEKVAMQRVGWYNSSESTMLAECGFAGLKNQGSTCYMNSFLQQLHLVPGFCQRLLACSAISTDNLLEALQRLFISMAETTNRHVETLPFCKALQTSSGSIFSFNEQKDVEEFMNQLFQEVEKCLAPDCKSIFTDFFGGKFLHQIISKECIHVSSREEEFFALQCQVQGKRTIEESLEAFVAGEPLDGDNKYFCDQCGVKVSATKRVCLKKLPPHLVLHLKRLDFDFDTMLRTKINSECQFPLELDVTPFTEAGLNAPGGSGGLIYKLTGVLIHRGTAQSGHYYSFASDRDSGQWLRFNDEDVAPFDPRRLREEAFGGGAGAHNAYLLVYDRVAGEARAVDPTGLGLARGRHWAPPREAGEPSPKRRPPTAGVPNIAPPRAMSGDIAPSSLASLDAAAACGLIWRENAVAATAALVQSFEFCTFALQLCRQSLSSSSCAQARGTQVALVVFFAHRARQQQAIASRPWVDAINALQNSAFTEPSQEVARFFLRNHGKLVNGLFFKCPHSSVREAATEVLSVCFARLYSEEKSAPLLWIGNSPPSLCLQVLSSLCASAICMDVANAGTLLQYMHLLLSFAQLGPLAARALLQHGLLNNLIHYVVGEDSPLPSDANFSPIDTLLLPDAIFSSFLRLVSLVMEHVDCAALREEFMDLCNIDGAAHRVCHAQYATFTGAHCVEDTVSHAVVAFNGVERTDGHCLVAVSANTLRLLLGPSHNASLGLVLINFCFALQPKKCKYFGTFVFDFCTNSMAASRYCAQALKSAIEVFSADLSVTHVAQFAAFPAVADAFQRERVHMGREVLCGLLASASVFEGEPAAVAGCLDVLTTAYLADETEIALILAEAPPPWLAKSLAHTNPGIRRSAWAFFLALLPKSLSALLLAVLESGIVSNFDTMDTSNVPFISWFQIFIFEAMGSFEVCPTTDCMEQSVMLLNIFVLCCQVLPHGAEVLVDIQPALLHAFMQLHANKSRRFLWHNAQFVFWLLFTLLLGLPDWACIADDEIMRTHWATFARRSRAVSTAHIAAHVGLFTALCEKTGEADGSSFLEHMVGPESALLGRVVLNYYLEERASGNDAQTNIAVLAMLRCGASANSFLLDKFLADTLPLYSTLGAIYAPHLCGFWHTLFELFPTEEFADFLLSEVTESGTNDIFPVMEVIFSALGTFNHSLCDSTVEVFDKASQLVSRVVSSPVMAAFVEAYPATRLNFCCLVQVLFRGTRYLDSQCSIAALRDLHYVVQLHPVTAQGVLGDIVVFYRKRLAHTGQTSLTYSPEREFGWPHELWEQYVDFVVDLVETCIVDHGAVGDDPNAHHMSVLNAFRLVLAVAEDVSARQLHRAVSALSAVLDNTAFASLRRTKSAHTLVVEFLQRQLLTTVPADSSLLHHNAPGDATRAFVACLAKLVPRLNESLRAQLEVAMQQREGTLDSAAAWHAWLVVAQTFFPGRAAPAGLIPPLCCVAGLQGMA